MQLDLVSSSSFTLLWCLTPFILNKDKGFCLFSRSGSTPLASALQGRLVSSYCWKTKLGDIEGNLVLGSLCSFGDALIARMCTLVEKLHARAGGDAWRVLWRICG